MDAKLFCHAPHETNEELQATAVPLCSTARA